MKPLTHLLLAVALAAATSPVFAQDDPHHPEEAATGAVAVRVANGLGAINSIKEWMLDIGRPHGDLYEVALWEDMLTVQGNELFYAYMVDNQAIVIPETIDAIRAICGIERSANASIALTDAALGIGRLEARPVPHGTAH